MFIISGIFLLCNIGIYIDDILQLCGVINVALENTNMIIRNGQGLWVSIFYARNALKRKHFSHLKDSLLKDDNRKMSDIMLL